MNYFTDVVSAIGNTPLIRLDRLKEKFSLKSNIFVKLERCNPSGSIKDRAARKIILNALLNKQIDENTELVEETSGNMGISLAMIAAVYKIPLRIYMPENCSIERVKMMRAYGANVILTKASLGMNGAKEEAIKYCKEHKNTYMPSQFENENNPLAHYLETADEIYKALDSKVDIFIAGFGTGGTLSGISKYLKEKNKSIKTIGVEPASSPLISEKQSGPHKIQGIGANFKPDTLHLEFVDEIKTCSNEEAYEFTRILAKEEGILSGISSGCNIAVSIKIAKIEENKNIVTVLPDNGERYLSTEGLYE